MVKAKIWVVNNRPNGIPSLSDFACIEEELPQCEEGAIIIEAVCYSVDPYQRQRIKHLELKTPITGSQVAKVIESKSESYKVGSYVVCYPGWRTHTHITAEDRKKPSFLFPLHALPDLGNHPISTTLGIMGMPGNTAYFGFLEICKPLAGETVVVNAAAGAVGSAVCQIAKIKGCTVIGFAGSDEKVSWLKDLGIDFAFNYKTIDVSAALTKAAPKGVNCYFDNVGGAMSASVMPHMAEFGRVSLCGCISIYNDESKDVDRTDMTGPYSEAIILWKQLKVEGFIVSRWLNRWMEGLLQLKQWIDEGKLKYRETTFDGFDKMPEAFLSLFEGKNVGKVIVKN